ncbi:hypothetical protein LSM04_002741 [Trypanosoma melophagium]|uniref:uncharacterized protein n=1 Tax=Trypanosoma melophagium TaxID=715481 RepID=UPI00351A7D67|nr:hypothetical protein LSM04_002741 [Trypanosoma melophagium]
MTDLAATDLQAQEELATAQRILKERELVNVNTMTDLAATDLQAQEELATAQRILQERELVNVNTMTDLAATDLQAQEELATAQRILQERELVNVNTMTDLAATDLQEQEELATAQRILQERELVNVNTMTDLAATDLQEQEELATAQRILQERELVNVNTMTDLAATDLQAQEELATAQRILQERELVNVNTMTDLAATDLQAQEELATAQRILQERELVNVNTMTDLAATDLQAQEELATAQRILKERELVNVNTMTDLAATDLQEQEELATAQRILKERELVNVNTMTDLAATDLQAQEELATAQRILQERELVNVNTMTDLAATDLQEQEEIILTQRALLRKRELEGLGVFNSRSGVVEADDVMSLPHMLEEICSSLTTVCLPDVLDAKIFESLRTVVDTLSIFNESLLNQNPMDVFESVEPQWGRAVEGGEPPEKIFPSDLLFYILRVSRDIFLPYANNISSTNSCSTKNGEEEETTIINCKEEKMVPFALKVLRDIAKGRSLGALSRFTRDEVVHAIDVVRDSFSNTVEARENDVLVLNSSGTLSDSVTVCDHTKAEVAAACNLLSTTLVQTVKVVGTEMLGLLHKRVHGGLTERELTLTCCILQDQLSSIVYTPPLHAVLLQQEVRDTIELMESVISVASTRQQQREENNEREVDNPTIDVLCSEAMKYALQTLRACISDDNSANADLLTVFYSEEVREAAVVLNRAVEAAKTQSLRNSEDTNDSNKNNNDDNNNENGNNSSKRNKRRGEAIRSKRTKDGFSTIREVHGDTQSAVIALRAYAAVLSDVYRDSETTSYLYTPNVLSAVDQLLQVLHRAVDMHITVSSGIPLLGRNNTPLLQLLQGARTNTREMLQRISLESPENQQEKEKEESEEFVDNHMSSRDRTSSPCVQAPSTAHVLNGLDCVVQKPSESSLNKKLGVTLEIEPMESIQPKEKKCEEVPLNTVDLNNPISNVRAEGSPEEGDAHTLVVTEVLSRTPSTRPRSLEPTVPVPNPTINNNYYKGEEEERGIRIRKHFADKTTSLIPFIRPLMKDVSVMTSDDKESLIFNCHVKDKQEKYDGIVQTEETAADLAIYMQFFLDTKAMLGKEKEINAAAELLAIIANMQRELEFLHNVEEPALKKELAEQECELKTIHGTLTKLQSLIQQHPCVSTSSSNEHKMPQMLREEVRDKSIPSRRRKASLRGPVLRVNYAEVPIPVSLPALGEKHSNTNTDDNTIINTTNINTNMNTAVVAEGIVEEVIMCFKTWHTLHANIVQHDAEAINRVKQLEKLLSIAKEERDTYSDKLNNLNITLSKQQTENKALRELLQTLHIDVDALNTALSQEQKAATAAAAAAAQMRQTAGQTELCEMAATELQLRSDELQSLRAELPRLRALRDAGLAGRKCELLRRGLRGLTRSVNTITALLQRESRFNTGTLETQRLLLLDSVAALTAEIAETQESLQQYIERRKIRDIVNSRMHYDDNNIPNDNNSNNNNNNNNNSTHGILVLDGERAVIASAHCGLE